jgi:hypothetical protein
LQHAIRANAGKFADLLFSRLLNACGNSLNDRGHHSRDRLVGDVSADIVA